MALRLFLVLVMSGFSFSSFAVLVEQWHSMALNRGNWSPNFDAIAAIECIGHTGGYARRDPMDRRFFICGDGQNGWLVNQMLDLTCPNGQQYSYTTFACNATNVDTTKI